MLTRLQDYLFPLELRERRLLFAESRKNNEFTYSYHDTNYKVTNKQTMYSTLFAITPYLAIPITFIFKRIIPGYRSLNWLLDIVLVVVTVLMIAKISLHLFIHESNENIIY